MNAEDLTRSDDAVAADIGAPPLEQLPAVIPPSPGPGRWRRLRPVGIVLLLLLAVAGGGYWWWLRSRPLVPPGFAWGNGRLEADEVDIDTKFAGRILKLYVDEGDLVKAGQVVASMDTRELTAQLKQYEQLVEQAQQSLEQARANKTAQDAVVVLARKELARTAQLVPQGFATVELLDQQTQGLNTAIATQNADANAIAAAQHALDAATHQVEFYAVEIADNQLFAPKNGPIEYRVANVGEVLAAGGKVFTMLDAGYVYMDIYLPAVQAGQVRIGSDARIVLDAYPDHVVPARVVFVASQAQFTPKTVETKDERDKLMFRIRVRIDQDRLEGREAMVRSGMPGVAFVRTNSAAVWPAGLTPSPPPPVAGAAQ
jgi:HlyD family secretion protein